MTERLTAVLAGALLLIAGCGAPGPATGSGSAAGTTGPSHTAGATDDGTADSLAVAVRGRTFLSTQVRGHDLVEGSRIRVDFRDDGSVGAQAGCNSMGGTARWAGDHLTVAQLSMTEMGCPGPLMDQDRWLADLFTGGLDLALDGDRLTITAGTVIIDLLDRVVADPDHPLIGTEWVLDGIISGTGDSAAVSSVPSGLSGILRVAADRLDVFNGLIWLSTGRPDAPIAIGADVVTVPEALAGDDVDCPGGGDGCVVDMSVLGSDFHYEITAGTLTVTGIGSTAGRGLVFRAEPAQP